MSSDNLLWRITVDPDICHGKPCIRGLRYPVESLLEYLAGGDSVDDLLGAAHAHNRNGFGALFNCGAGSSNSDSRRLVLAGTTFSHDERVPESRYGICTVRNSDLRHPHTSGRWQAGRSGIARHPAVSHGRQRSLRSRLSQRGAADSVSKLANPQRSHDTDS
ncbi:MAG: DUF433 domain-containing protein [Verrucomicrobia bacterium]|nr:DUF433 domain-containing protein [Verrucomicrobiota bacterium]